MPFCGPLLLRFVFYFPRAFFRYFSAFIDAFLGSLFHGFAGFLGGIRRPVRRILCGILCLFRHAFVLFISFLRQRDPANNAPDRNKPSKRFMATSLIPS